MTVMLDKFFGLHPAVVRSGTWAKLKPGEKDLLVYLMHESERCRTREMRRTDAQIHASVGTAPRTLCNARKRLAEYGLIQYSRANGGKFVYIICNPETGKPYAGDPRQRAQYQKLAVVSPPDLSAQPVTAALPRQAAPSAVGAQSSPPPEVCFLHGNQDVWYRPDGSPFCGACHPGRKRNLEPVRMNEHGLFGVFE